MSSTCSMRMRNDQPDGRIISRPSDPPGQRSTYIIPGDTRKQTYRLSTFKEYPASSPMSPIQLSSNGFYFTGYKDRVKCFCCGQAVDQWQTGDDAASSTWHKSDCDFVKGRDITNISLNPLSAQRQQWTKKCTATALKNSFNTFSKAPRPAGEILMSQFNNQVSQPNVTDIIHQTARCIMPTSIPPASVTASLAATENIETNVVSPSARNEDLFPCKSAMKSSMRSQETRLQTFEDNKATWSSYRINATPQQMAEAGFYYTGVRDNVKCWYCDGSLESFEQNDDPWEEHAKWFPMCEFLLQRKGLAYVERITDRYPRLTRPSIRNPAANISFSSVPSARFRFGDVPPQRHNSPPPTRQIPVLNGTQQQQREIFALVQKDLTSSELVSTAKELGFEAKDIAAVLKRRYEQKGECFPSHECLVGALLEYQSESCQQTEESESASASPEIDPVASAATSAKTIEELEKDRRCKSCLKEQACYVFMPCGHLAACLACGDQLQKCSICKKNIYQKIHAYLA